MSTVIVTGDNIRSEVFGSSLPVLINFWSSYNQEKKSLSALEQMSNELEGIAKIVRVNVNDEPDIAYRFKVEKVPTTMIYRSGSVTDTIVGNAGIGMLKWIIEHGSEEQTNMYSLYTNEH